MNRSSDKALILVNGRLVLHPSLLLRLKEQAFGCVIAADGGARHALSLGLKVDYWLGDFDSSQDLIEAQPSVAFEYCLKDALRQSHPSDKNQLDAELAILQAKKLGMTSALVVGAFGGRFDHAFALALLALRCCTEGFFVELHSGDECAWPILAGSTELALLNGQTFSLLPTQTMSGLELTGARWPLHKVNMPVGMGWGVSNIALGKVKINLQSGAGLLVAQVRD